jgi:hypothetical protein
MKTPSKTKLKWGLYTPKNIENALRLKNMIDLFNNHDLKPEARILENLRAARSNYLYAFASKSRGGKTRIGAYTNSFKKAKQNARLLIKELQACPCANVFASHVTIEDYLRTECRAVT